MNNSLSLEQQQQLRRLLENGLPLTARPYQVFAEQINSTEQAVIEHVQGLDQQGLFRRFGIVVKHRALGITANVMLVMDIEDERVHQVGQALGEAPGVNLCYRRPRRPGWPYNLFCMVHGRDRQAVEAHVAELLAEHNLHELPHHMPFSTRAFKQRGGRYNQTGTL